MTIGVTGVKIEYTRAAVKSGDLQGAWDGSGGAVAHALAKAIKRRVQKRGDLAGQTPPPYASKNPRYVSPRYPISGGEITESGLRYFESSRELHATTRRGTYDVTGGMWDGFSQLVAPRGGSLRFRGRSVGQEFRTVIRKLKSYRGGARQGRMSMAKISNALKAWVVLESHGVNLLMLSDRELAAIPAGLTAAMRRQLKSIGTAAIKWEGGGFGNSYVSAEIIRRLS